MKKKQTFVFWSFVSFLAIFNLLVFDLFIVFGEERLQVQFVPDDTYYYLQLAKNFVKFGSWTFDSGLSIASGFHPLLAYILAGFYGIFHPGIHEFAVSDMILCVLLTLGTVIGIWVISLRQQNVNFLIMLTLCVSARSFLINSVSGVEWPFVVLFVFLYSFVFYTDRGSLKGLVGMFAIGLLLSLARTDTGLFPFALFLVSLVLAGFNRIKDKTALMNSFSGLLGAVAGTGVAFLNNYLFTGSFLQSSARMKFLWSQFGGSAYSTTVTVPLRTIGFDFYFDSFNDLVRWVPFFYLYLLLTLFILQRRQPPVDGTIAWPGYQNPRYKLLFFASFFCVVGYNIVYRYNGVIQNWYTANFILPIFVLGAGVIGYLQRKGRNGVDLAAILFSLITIITFIANIFWTYPVERYSPWPHQQLMLDVGKYLSQHPLDGRVGAWNSGIIGYYQGGYVVNIDGLVNEDIYSHAVNNTLPAYLNEKDVRYVVDFQNMFDPWFRRRGGYDDSTFLQNLHPLMVFDEGQFPYWKFLTLYKVGD